MVGSPEFDEHYSNGGLTFGYQLAVAIGGPWGLRQSLATTKVEVALVPGSTGERYPTFDSGQGSMTAISLGIGRAFDLNDAELTLEVVAAPVIVLRTGGFYSDLENHVGFGALVRAEAHTETIAAGRLYALLEANVSGGDRSTTSLATASRSAVSLVVGVGYRLFEAH